MGQLLSTSVNALISSGKEFQERHHPGFHEDVDRKTSSKACCTQPWRSTRVCCLCALSSACHRIFFSGYNAHRYLSRKLTWKLNMRILHRNLLFCQKKPLVFGVCHIRWKCFFFRGVPRNHASRWPREVPKLAPGRPGEKVEKREVLFDPFRIQEFFLGVDSPSRR